MSEPSAFPLRFRLVQLAMIGCLQLLMLGPLVALATESKIGAFMVVGALAGYVTIHHAMGFAAVDVSPDNPYPRFRVFGSPTLTAAYSLAFTAMFGGAAFALLDRGLGTTLLLAGLATRLTLDLAIGVARYREVMRRLWPAVAPLGDEDDW